MSLPTVHYVNLGARMVIMTDGTAWPIAEFYDDEGEECEPRDACACVCGTEDRGWLEVEIHPPTSAYKVH